jgi:flagellar hook-associated protein FlgK
MTSLFDVGKSAIQTYRQSLAVTGQNIANLNTDGYVRRQADLEEISASQSGITGLANQAGLGVRVADVRRSFDQFLADRKLTANSGFERLNKYVQQLRRVEDLLLPSESDLGVQIGNFFRALSDVSAAPADLAPRAVAIEQGRTLASAFNTTAEQLEQARASTVARVHDALDGANLLADELASVNDRILSSGQSGKSPNALLDLRDRLIGDISALTDITVSYTDRGVANITLGNSGVGPSLVTGGASTKLGMLEGSNNLQIVLNPGASNTPTSQVSSGVIAGLSDAFSVIADIRDKLGALAQQIKADINAQHRRGVTMDGLAGLDMFSTAGLNVTGSLANPAALSVETSITDWRALPRDKLTVTFDQSQNAWLVTDNAAHVVAKGRQTIKAAGFTLTISGHAVDGNSFIIQPSRDVAASLRFLLTRPQDIAAASPDLVTPAATNKSDAALDVTRVTAPGYPPAKTVADVFENSLSPIQAKEFLNDSFLATIPAGTDSVSLSSFSRQATAKFHLSGLALGNLTSLSFGRVGSANDGPHQFDIRYGTAYPSDASGTVWQNAADIANMLNKGVLRSAGNLSFADLGMVASGAGGSLTVTSATGDFVSTGTSIPSLATGAGLITATVYDAVTASDLQLFTREGRHLAGAVLTNAQIAEFITDKNGFDEQANYDARYLNLVDGAYRGMDMTVSFSGGMYQAEMATGSLAGGVGLVPANAVTADNVAIAAPNGETYNAAITGGASAEDIAAAINNAALKGGVRAEAKTRVEIYDIQATGLVSFDLAAENSVPVSVSADVTASNISNLAVAINKLSDRTGLTAVVSPENDRLILESIKGADIAISDLLAGSPSFSARMVDVNSLPVSGSSSLTLNSAGVSGRIDSARFSGAVNLVSSGSFSLTSLTGTVNAAQNPMRGGNVAVSSNATGNSKQVRYNAAESVESGDAALDGSKAVAPAASYSLTVPSSDNLVSFSATVFATDLPDISAKAVATKLAEILRETAPIASLSANEPATKAQVTSFSFARTEAVVPADDTVTVKINGVDVPVDLADIDGSNTPASNGGDVAAAIVRAVNAADLGITATVSGTLPQTGVTLTANKPGVGFTVNTFRFDDLNEIVAQPQFALVEDVPSRALPEDGTVVTVNFGAQTYRLEMQDGEIHVTGDEAGRVTAYLDSANKLQIFGGGSLAGQPIVLASDNEVSGNSAAAARFGLIAPISRLAGQQLTLAPGLPDLALTFDSTVVTVSLDAAGVVTTVPATVAGLTVRWDAATPTTGRLIAEYDSKLHSLTITTPQDALGFKVTDREIRLQDDVIKVASTDNRAFALSASATSLAATQVKLDNLPQEDLLVFVTGGGARTIGAEFSLPVTKPDLTRYEIHAIGNDGNLVEIWDADTGHSIATRVISGDKQARYSEFEFLLHGKAADGDVFTLQQDAVGTGDGRNINRIIDLREGDGKIGGFQAIFGAMIAEIGASVQSAKIAAETNEESLMAAREAESEFSGVNLDSEAAALIEFQQAYQASARILSTARELFQSLMEVV